MRRASDGVPVDGPAFVEGREGPGSPAEALPDQGAGQTCNLAGSGRTMDCMKPISVVAGLLAFTAALAGAREPDTRIHWAVSWDDAVTEAQALNMPIVVHRHGFY